MEMLDEIFIPNNNIKFDDELDYSRVDELLYKGIFSRHILM